MFQAQKLVRLLTGLRKKQSLLRTSEIVKCSSSHLECFHLILNGSSKCLCILPDSHAHLQGIQQTSQGCMIRVGSMEEATKWPNNPTSGYMSEWNIISILKRYLHTCVHCSILHYRQDTKTTHKSLDRWIGIYSYNLSDKILLLLNREVMSDFFWSYGLQHAKLLYPPLAPRVCSNSRPLSRWCYLTISSSTAPFSFCLQSFSASGKNPAINMDESGGHYVKRNKSDKAKYCIVLLIYEI